MKAFLLLTISLFLLAEDFTGDHKKPDATKPNDTRPQQEVPISIPTVFSGREEKFTNLKNSKTFEDNIKRMYATDCIVRTGTDFERKQGVAFLDGKNKPPRLYGLYFRKPYDPSWLKSYKTYKSTADYTDMYLQNMKDPNRPKALRQGVVNGSEHFLKTNGDISINYYFRGVVGPTTAPSILYEITETKREKKKDIVYKKTICEASEENVIQLTK